MKLAPLSPKQQRSIAQSTGRLNVWHGSVRSGKTIASIIRWAHAVAESKGAGDLIMVGKTERTLERNVLRPMEQLFGSESVDLRRGIGQAFLFGKRIDLVGANDERAEQKIRGGTFEKLYGDEVTLWPESFFLMGLSRMSVPSAEGFFTTNPDAPGHWLKRNFLDRKALFNAPYREGKAVRPGLREFHFTLHDNTTLSQEYIDSIAIEYTGLWKKRFVDGLWVLAEGVIWDAFDVERHLLERVPEDVRLTRYVVGVDYGTTNPFVALLFGYGSNGSWYLLDEWRWDSTIRGYQQTDAEYSQHVARWLTNKGVAIDRMWVDPSAASFILQARRDGLPAMEAENDVLDGLRTVAQQIAQNNLFMIQGTTQSVVDEVSGYIWDQKAQLRGEDAPLKQKDHAPDAIRYAILSELRHPSVDVLSTGWVA